MINKHIKKIILSYMIIFILLGSFPILNAMELNIVQKNNDVNNNISIGLTNTLYVGNDDPNSFDSIQEAIIAADSGDTIQVFDDSSPYYESIVIDKPLTIIGENSSSTIIDGGNKATTVHISSAHVNFSGFTIKKSGTGSHDAGLKINSDDIIIYDVILFDNHMGISLEYAHDVSVSKSKIYQQDTIGIYCHESTNIILSENMIRDNLVGIHLDKNARFNTVFANSLVSNDDQGILLQQASHNDIYWNIISDSHRAIELRDASSNDIYDENLLTENTVGLFLQSSFDNKIYDNNMITYNEIGIYLFQSDNNDIHENQINHNSFGIVINDSSNVDFYWNEIQKNIHGIEVINSFSNEIYLNNILDNYQNGLFIEMSSFTKVFYNNFIGNYIHSSFTIPFFSLNSWKENYWDDWEKTGFYEITGEFETMFPLNFLKKYDFSPSNEPYDI